MLKPSPIRQTEQNRPKASSEVPLPQLAKEDQTDDPFLSDDVMSTSTKERVFSDFETGRLIQGIFDSEKDSKMGYTPSPNFFATIFPKEAQQLQQYQQQVFIANTRADEEHAKYEEASAKHKEISAKLKALERVLCEKMRKAACKTLKTRHWFDEIPQEITNVLERMTSYTRLEGVLEAAQNEKNYDDFLKALKKIRR